MLKPKSNCTRCKYFLYSDYVMLQRGHRDVMVCEYRRKKIGLDPCKKFQPNRPFRSERRHLKTKGR